MTVWLEIGGRRRRVELSALELSGLGEGSQASLREGLQGGLVACVVDGRSFVVDVREVQAGVMSLVVAPSTARDSGTDEGKTSGSGLEVGRQYRCVLDGDAVVVGGRRFEFVVEDPRSLKGRRGVGAGKDGPRPVKAPMPGRVVRVLADVGDEVAEQQGVVVIEAMKMQNELKSPKAGRVVKVSAVVGETVQQGDVLVVVE
jgi:biotin carboxyl carrier protein